jgi:hypothetical protein
MCYLHSNGERKIKKIYSVSYTVKYNFNINIKEMEQGFKVYMATSGKAT